MKSLIGLIVFSFSLTAFCADGTSVTSLVAVQKIQGSEMDKAEKWIDSEHKVVCYVAQHTGSGTGVAISCLPIVSPR